MSTKSKGPANARPEKCKIVKQRKDKPLAVKTAIIGFVNNGWFWDGFIQAGIMANHIESYQLTLFNQ